MSTKTASTPSQAIADAQIGKFFDQLRPVVRDLGISGDEFQKQVLEREKELRIQSQFREWLQGIIAEATNTVVVIAKRVDYTRAPMQVIRATGRVEYIDEAVANTMPRRCQGIVENVPVEFFCLRRNASVEEVDREFERRGLEPDPYALAAINEEDPAFADKYPNGTQWGRDGKVASYLAFRRWCGGGRGVRCDRDGVGWGGVWWWSGVRKVSPPKAEE